MGQLLYYQLTHDYLVPSLRDWLTRVEALVGRLNSAELERVVGIAFGKW